MFPLSVVDEGDGRGSGGKGKKDYNGRDGILVL